MQVFLFAIIAILLFMRLADKHRFRLFIPAVVAAVFIRLVQQLILIDWLQLMQISASRPLRFWIPVSAELTVWATAAYLFIQYMPEKNRFLYGSLWVALMTLFLQALRWLNVITYHNGWNVLYCALSVAVDFLLLSLIWNWLRRGADTAEASLVK